MNSTQKPTNLGAMPIPIFRSCSPVLPPRGQTAGIIGTTFLLLSLPWWTGCQGKPEPTGPTGDVASTEDSIAKMRQRMKVGDWQGAETFAGEALIRAPDDPDLLTDAARIAARLDRTRDGAHLLVDAAKAADFAPSTRVEHAVQALIDVGELYSAIELLEASLQSDPDNDRQRKFLIGFLAEAQRTELIPPHMKRLIRDRGFDLPLLVVTTETSSRRLSTATAEKLMRRNPDDHRVRLSEAFVAMYRRDPTAAKTILDDILAHHPDFGPAHAMAGQVISATGKWDRFAAWLADAPDSSRNYAGYWLTIGDHAAEAGKGREAIRAYWEATRRDPNRHLAWDRLATEIRRADAAGGDTPRVTPKQLQVISDHASRLLELRERFHEFTGGDSRRQSGATAVAEALAKLGRTWEAEAWSAMATTLVEDPSPRLKGFREEIIARLQQDSSWMAKSTPALNLDLSSFPLPEFSAVALAKTESLIKPEVLSADHLRFEEQSRQWGLQGVGQTREPENAQRDALIRSTGKGGGAIDYDLDGLPDLIAMGNGGDMSSHGSNPNTLHRNVGNRFDVVTNWAGIDDRGNGQGVAVGDFNEDGFPDLFFANLGSNRLFRNNGDGTFSEATLQLRDGGAKRWSTSAAFADFDRDGITDLYVASYCKADAALEESCLNTEGEPGPCHPLRFSGDDDQVLTGDRNGRLLDTSDHWIGQVTLGRGLGVLVGAIGGDSPEIYVANDMSRNHYYSRADAAGDHSSGEGDQSGEDVRWTESAAARGIAVDGRSLAQASMGIAASDLDLDGDLDLYVTGFAREYNVYYEQVSPGLWKDRTSRQGLAETTLRWVGFGTQAVDIDNDGIDELIISNGHISQFDDPEAPPYAQPMQLFRRDESGRFVEIDDDGWGNYFSESHIGRSLWKTDVNRDGFPDVMITHNYEPICLLINRTESDHHRVAFRLVGTSDHRDAIGAVIRFRCNGRQRTLWLLAGTGYLCSNEPALLAGLGDAETVQEVTVTWQDGTVDQIGDLDSDHEYVVVQGSGEAFVVGHYPQE